MVNELTIIKQIDQKLKKNHSERNIFPISAMHRKELRDLRNVKIGDLNNQLSIIRKLKEEEFYDKNKHNIEKSLEKSQDTCTKLNHNWSLIVLKINKIIEERKKYEEKFDINNLTLEHSYSNLSSLRELDTKRFFRVRMHDITKKISKQQFNDKYGKQFDTVNKHIHDLTTKYEEAINFGDLETVKQLYYIMKDSENFFVKVSNMKI